MTVLSTLSRIALAVALAAAATLAAAQVFPIKPVKIIVGFPAGGPLDAHARLLADRLGQLLARIFHAVTTVRAEEFVCGDEGVG